MAKILKTAMQNEAKTAAEIMEIIQQQTNIENKDKQYNQRVYAELLNLKILIRNTITNSITDTDKYTFSDATYDKLVSQHHQLSLSLPQTLKDNSDIPL